ncbi:Hypothetical predicted protein [Prunus dulcis]|uniref:Uncharacterized protein n=1 Tax=Prunus dulcis TaxID=3755 RepID=A0A5E4E9W2_PRUDU|nr:Hypothetical predicted protein [Prunus dulcis]
MEPQVLGERVSRQNLPKEFVEEEILGMKNSSRMKRSSKWERGREREREREREGRRRRIGRGRTPCLFLNIATTGWNVTDSAADGPAPVARVAEISWLLKILVVIMGKFGGCGGNT